MFRKSKTNEHPPPPPSIEEILSDLEGSSHIENKAAEDLLTSGNDNDAWWTEFQQFMNNLKAALVINTEVNSYIPKLEDSKTSLENSEKQLQKDIEEQQTLICNVLEKASSA